MLGKVIVSSHNIEEMIRELSADIDSHYNKLVSETNPLVVISVLKGSFIFTSDLIRHMYVPLVVDFIGVESYDGNHSTQSVRLTKGITTPIKDCHVLIVEDIIDTGLSMNFLINYLSAFNPKSLKICTLLYKKENCKFPIEINFLGTDIPNIFVVGYGLDFKGMHRNLTSIREWRE